jgi:hypothetical protein
MTNFNPKSNKFTADQWQIIASETISESNAQCLVIGGIIGGFIAASATAFPPTGLLVAAWALYEAWRKTAQVNRNEQAIAKYGCIAHVLTGDNLRDYRAQVGDEEVMKQIEWASGNGYALSIDAQDFLETQKPFIRRQLQPAQTTDSVEQSFSIPVSQNQKLTDTQVGTSDKQTPDLPAVLAATLKNSLIVGVPGAGKGIFVSNALDQLKRHKGKTTVFYLDPKGDPNESGYFTGRVNKLYRADVITQSADDIFNWLQKSLDDFDSSAVDGVKLLVLDELTALAGILQTVKGAIPWLKSRLTSYSSSGSSRGIIMWGIAQNAHIADLGFGGGTRSIFIPVFLISSDQVTASIDILRCGMIPSEKRLTAEQIQSLCDKSPVSRAIYFGITNEWYPAPKMENYSGFDRDTRTFLPGYAPPKNDRIATDFDSLARLEELLKSETEKKNLSELAQKILNFFNATKKKEPKTLRDLKKTERLAGHSDTHLIIALTELVNTGELIFDGEDSWTKSEW